MSVGRIEDFALERYFARYEFAVRHQLSASDVEPLTMAEVLAMADADARTRWDTLSLGYTESNGLPALRAEIAAMYQHVAPDDVLVFAGARMVLVPLEFERGWTLDVDAVARAVSSRTRVIVVNFPHNPTGAHISAETQRRLVQIADDAGAVLFSDEVYRGLEYRREDALPPAADLSRSALSLGVMSKSFALAGLRIGWIATRDAALIDRVVRLKDYTTICSSAPSEILALAALRARERVLERSRAIVSANVDAARRFFDAHGGQVEWVPPRAGSVAFPRFRTLSADELSPRLAERRNVLLMPGSVFGGSARHFRLGLGRTDLPLALDALASELRET